MLHTAVRTQDSVILNDASAQMPFSADEYVREKHARSVLCLPLVKQGKLVGALYLENNLAPRVFTSAKLAVLKLLASQAAISLENVQLYDELRRSEAYLSEAQRLSHTGTFGWNPSSGEMYWSEESFRIFEYDPAIIPTFGTDSDSGFTQDDAALPSGRSPSAHQTTGTILSTSIDCECPMKGSNTFTSWPEPSAMRQATSSSSLR